MDSNQYLVLSKLVLNPSPLFPSSLGLFIPYSRLVATLYKSLGIDSHTILALAAVYGTVAFIFNCLTTKYLTDQWGRRKYIILQLNKPCCIPNKIQNAPIRLGRHHYRRDLRSRHATRVPKHRQPSRKRLCHSGNLSLRGSILYVTKYFPNSTHKGETNTEYLGNKTDGMLNSTTWLYGAEVLPIALRSKVMGLAAASHFIVNVAS